MKNKNGFIISIIITLVAMAILPMSVFGQELRIAGSSTMRPAIEEIAIEYSQTHGVDFSIVAGGSGAGVLQVISGEMDIGMASRNIYDEEKVELLVELVALDTIVFVVHESNPLESITKDQLRKIYTGEHTNWNEFGLDDKQIVLVNKEIGRATLDLFENYTELYHPNRQRTDRASITTNTLEIGANIEAAALVGGIPSAIGYLSLGTTENVISQGMPIKKLRLDGIDPIKRNVINQSYPIVRELNLVYRQEQTDRVDRFIEMVIDEKGQRILEKY